jgi:diadenosine tetraphosphate (Ap4A) HIT family hydrolase
LTLVPLLNGKSAADFPVSPFFALSQERILMANRLAMAIRNGFPVSPGHTLIIPKRHVAIFFETRTEAWQTILDLYFHLIPRYAGVDADPRGGVRRIFPKKVKYW